MANKLTLADIEAKASKYDNKTDFITHEHAAYQRAKEMGVVDEVCAHMSCEYRIGWGYWNHDNVIKEAKKYDYKTDFQKGSPGAFNAARANGWYEEATAHMINQRTVATLEDCRKEARKYDTRMDFKAGSPGYYNVCVNHGWLDDVCSHMKVLRHDWTLEQSREIASGYKTRVAFQKGDAACYNYAHRRGWLDDICSHMKRQGHIYKRQIYAFEFSDHSVYIGLSCNVKRRKSEHLRNNTSVFKKIAKDKVTWEFKILTDLLDKEAAAIEESKLMEQYRNDGWLLVNRIRGGGLGYPGNDGISIAEIYEKASHYDRRIDFTIAWPGCVSKAQFLGIMDDVCKHMKKYDFMPSREEVYAKAREYHSVREFKIEAPGYYNRACKCKYIKELLSDVYGIKEG